MKILCLIDTLTFGGAQTQLVSLACDFKKSGHSVSIAIYHDGMHYKKQLLDAGVDVVCFRKKARFSILPILRLRRFLKKNSFDIALAFLYTPAFYLELACIGLPKTKIVVSERSVIPDGKKTWALRLYALLHLLADAVTTNNNTHYNWLKMSFPWLSKKLLLIKNGVNLSNFCPSLKKENKNLELSLLAVARIQPEKNAKNLAKAVAICRLKMNIRVNIKWAGQIVDPVCYSECCTIIEKAGIKDAWTWLGVRNDVNQLMRENDALVMPSFYEGHPNAICEAMASGLPVLASDVCDNSQFVRSGLTGFLFRPESPDDIARAIAEFYVLDNDKRQFMAKNCRDYAIENLSNERCSKEYQNLFMNLYERTNQKSCIGNN
ncbi:MAG: hypothetical protein C0412_01605 [Flavobacterium sp.]|nr:hypothetical protein [Flavobacterium sp.]